MTTAPGAFLAALRNPASEPPPEARAGWLWPVATTLARVRAAEQRRERARLRRGPR
ncbi:hypothetical protein [Streptomyces sp. NPDC051665]|uniref:hypothetical protein n=1 Tax=Streptomyces sp. NPDC051665 TaxID=3154647 RepID=UPI00341AAAC3